MNETSQKLRTAVVLSGGGTRGAYEAGVIHYIRSQLPPRLTQELAFQIFCGSSVGAINASFLAATADTPKEQGNRLVEQWRNLRTEQIYRSGTISLGRLILRSLVGVTSHLLGIKGFRRPNDRALHFQGFFDTQPFFSFLRQGTPWPNITKNINNGLVEALVISATNMTTGAVELFLQKNPHLSAQPRLLTQDVKLTPRHVMASAALPILFPPVPVSNTYYYDGGLRLNTPLAPAVSLGASRILLIGTQHRLAGETLPPITSPELPHFPSLGETLGALFHSIFLDRLRTDREQVQRINRVLDAVSTRVSPEVYDEITQEARVQKIEALSIFPSVDIASLVDDTAKGSLQNLRTLSTLERAILRFLETDPKTGTNFLSYFLFEPSYIQKLIDLGYEDGRKHHDDLAEFAERSIANTPLKM